MKFYTTDILACAKFFRVLSIVYSQRSELTAVASASKLSCLLVNADSGSAPKARSIKSREPNMTLRSSFFSIVAEDWHENKARLNFSTTRRFGLWVKVGGIYIENAAVSQAGQTPHGYKPERCKLACGEYAGFVTRDR